MENRAHQACSLQYRMPLHIQRLDMPTHRLPDCRRELHACYTPRSVRACCFGPVACAQMCLSTHIGKPTAAACGNSTTLPWHLRCLRRSLRPFDPTALQAPILLCAVCMLLLAQTEPNTERSTQESLCKHRMSLREAVAVDYSALVSFDVPTARWHLNMSLSASQMLPIQCFGSKPILILVLALMQGK